MRVFVLCFILALTACAQPPTGNVAQAEESEEVEIWRAVTGCQLTPEEFWALQPADREDGAPYATVFEIDIAPGEKINRRCLNWTTGQQNCEKCCTKVTIMTPWGPATREVCEEPHCWVDEFRPGWDWPAP